MKKLSFVLMVMLLVNAAVVSAEEPEPEDEGIGLTTSLELGFGDVADKAVFSLTPGIVYEKSFGAVDVFGELDYTAAFGDPSSHELYFEVELGYNLRLAKPSVLSFIVNNKNTFALSPALEDGATHRGIVEPSLKYTHTFGFGDLFVQAGCPIGYLTGVEDETAAGIYGRLGWASTFGLGLAFTSTVMLHPDADFFGEDLDLYGGYGALVWYEAGVFYGEVECKAEKEFQFFALYPEIDISLGSWTFTARMELCKYDGIDDWTVKPFIGAGYRF